QSREVGAGGQPGEPPLPGGRPRVATLAPRPHEGGRSLAHQRHSVKMGNGGGRNSVAVWPCSKVHLAINALRPHRCLGPPAGIAERHPDLPVFLRVWVRDDWHLSPARPTSAWSV